MPRTSAKTGKDPQTGQYPSTQLGEIEDAQRRLQAWRNGTGSRAMTAWSASASAPETAAISLIRWLSWQSDAVNSGAHSRSAWSAAFRLDIFGVPAREAI